MNSPFRISDETLAARQVAFVKARWHADIVDQCQAGFERTMAGETPPWHIEVFEAPGAFEIPLLARDLARSGRYAAIRSAERRVGQECGSTCRSRWSPLHSKK